MKCPYCGNEAKLVGGDKIYPSRPDLADKSFYQCDPCDAYVGCHRGTTVPLGRLADSELRRAKMAAHAAFDPIWQKGFKDRSQAYQWLSETLDVEKKDCHIGMFNVDQCRKVAHECLFYRAKLDKSKIAAL